MLALQIDAEWIDLAPDAAMNITINNPAFDPQRIGRAYSYPIRIQHTQRNLFITKHQHRLDSRGRQQYLSAKAYIKDQLFQEGRVLLEEATSKFTEAIFQNFDISRLETLADIEIRSLMPTISITQTERATYKLTPGSGPVYQITINDTLYQEGALGVPKNTALAGLASDINADYPGTALYNAIDDLFELRTTEDEFNISFAATMFTLFSEQTLADARQLNLEAYIDSVVGDSAAPVAFPVVYVPKLYSNQNFRFQGYANWRLNSGYLDNGHYDKLLWETTYIPFVKLRYVLDQVASTAGLDDIIFSLPADQQADMDSLLIWNNYTLDEVRLENNLEANGLDLYKNGFKTAINLAEHVPDYTAEELLQRLASSCNLHFKYENNKLYLVPNRQQIAQAELDWTSYTQPEYERTFTDGDGVTISFEEDIDDPFETQFDNFTIGDGNNELELPFRPIHASSRPNFNNSGHRWKTATVEQKGSTDALEMETEQLTLRLFFDRGQQQDENGDTYWLGSYDNTDYDGASTGAFSLDFPGEAGLYNTFWKDWAVLIFSPLITRLIQLPVSELLQAKKWQRTKVYIYDNQGATLAVILRIQFTASTNRLGLAKVEMQKLAGS